MINTPSMLREMEFAYRIGRLKGGVSAKAIFEMALRARRLEDPKASVGIRVGERADLVVLDLPGGTSGFASMMRASASDVSLVVSGGVLWPGKGAVMPQPPRRRRSS